MSSRTVRPMQKRHLLQASLLSAIAPRLAAAADVASHVKPFTRETPVTEVISDPAFEGFGRLLFPVNRGFMSGLRLGNISLTWYSHIDPEKTVEIVNHLRDLSLAGRRIFIPIWSEEEMRAEPSKRDTGLFFFPGKPGARFAVLSAGGGFAYVGAMHDSFPAALELSKRGFNAFALIYRPDAQKACEDLARAVTVIVENAAEFGVNPEGYSLWGGSAGARMAAWVGTYGTAAFGQKAVERPAAIVMQYTGHSDFTRETPPVYANVGDDDWIANWHGMEMRMDALQRNGIPTEFHHYPGLGLN
ncbi:alpha/beta hydrolase [Sutterella sp.]|uniref:alpha/beta hydrolase n=1 Tax=Sutterella sp. TaxID=1981025 RepID=UPI0026DEABEE|nr:alpha/beta hydrolase [Sutterella sp.]MDO5532348.1 alpha/beta hydrolase [Sutterella sp.]